MNSQDNDLDRASPPSPPVNSSGDTRTWTTPTIPPSLLPPFHFGYRDILTLSNPPSPFLELAFSGRDIIELDFLPGRADALQTVAS
jgi:hypothetical protein